MRKFVYLIINRRKELKKNGKDGIYYLIIVTIAWIIAWIVGMFENVWLGIIGLVTIVGLGLLFIKALTDRLASKKDDKYSRDVKK
jgi:hypothetical protein